MNLRGFETLLQNKRLFGVFSNLDALCLGGKKKLFGVDLIFNEKKCGKHCAANTNTSMPSAGMCAASASMCAASASMCAASASICVASAGWCAASAGICMASAGWCVASAGMCAASASGCSVSAGI